MFVPDETAGSLPHTIIFGQKPAGVVTGEVQFLTNKN